MAMSVKTSLSALDSDLTASHRAQVRSVRQKLLVWRAVSIVSYHPRMTDDFFLLTCFIFL